MGQIGDKEVVIQQCGIGKVNAAIGAVEMITHYQPDIIVSSGCAGGADTRLKVTDVVVGTSYTYHDVYCGTEVEYGQFIGLPAYFEADEQLVQTALSLGSDYKGHGLSPARRRCATFSAISPMPRQWIWRVVPLHKPAICTKCPSCRSASSATFLCSTPMHHNTSTSGAVWQKVPSRSPKHLWKG